MPDSDPSSTSTAVSCRDIPADDDGDGCRWREHDRAGSRHDVAAPKAAVSHRIAEAQHRSPAPGVIRVSYFHRKRSGLFNVAALNH
jgi:hypothetical protein